VKSACSQVRDKMDESNFAGIARTRKHAFTKKCSANANAIKSTYKCFALPALHTMGMTTAKKRIVKL
jgi:hypothetical protein